MLTILNLLPELLNVNGDAENARVLASRARWSGIEAEVVTDCALTPDLVIIGSGFDGDIELIAAGMRSVEPQLASAVLRGVPVLAIGLGFELLGGRVSLADGTTVDGLGLIPGHAEPLAERAVGDIVVVSTIATLVGYENHGRSYVLDETTPVLGSVAVGVGNGDAARREGIIVGSVIGSHIHGPLLALNPHLADQMLATATNGQYSAANPQARWADSLAAASRAKVLSAHGLPSETVRRRSQPADKREAAEWLI